jgi:DNA-binding CsgD family transcriptional regulator
MQKNRSKESIIRDFYIDQDFVKDDLDYRIVENHVKTLQHIASMSNQCFWIFDYYKNQFYYISDNTSFFPKKDRALMQNGYDYIIRHTHPDDILYLLSIHKASWNFLRKISAQKVATDFKVCYGIRMLNISGKYIPVNQQVKLFATDRLGNIWLSLGMFEETTGKINYLPYIQDIHSGKKNPLFNKFSRDSFEVPNLSKREQELLNYLSGYYSQTEISRLMDITHNTLKSHRKSLYKKLHATTRNEVLKHAYYLGFINLPSVNDI